MGSLGFRHFQQGHNFDELPFALAKKGCGRRELAATVKDVRHKEESAPGGDFMKINKGTATGGLDNSQAASRKIRKGSRESQGG